MSDKKTHYMAGLKAFGEGKHAEAIASFEAALAEAPDWSDCLQALSMAQMNSGDLEKALETAKRICELASEDPLAFTGLSMIYQRLDRIEDAETAQNKARMLSWKQELKENPDAPPPTGMNVVQ
jgi:Flp pilus assembly protein TadD